MRACELTNASVVAFDRLPHVVQNIQVQTPSARGGATLYKVRFRNLTTDQKLDKTFKGDDVLQETEVERRPVQFSYHQHGTYVFMDIEDYTEFSLQEKEVEAETPYLVEDMEGISVLLCDGKIVGLELPPAVELKIVECDPSIRGASASARTKPATLSTGLVVQVPEYMSSGEIIRVDTRTGKFLSRA